MTGTRVRISVLIPAYNEALRIGETVRAALGVPAVVEAVVVDDGSEDETSKVAEKAGARVVRLERNAGKGKALTKGLSSVKGEIVVLLDADVGDTGGEIAKLVAPILAGEADLVIASFPKARRKGGFGLVRGLARMGIKFLTGLELKTPLSGQRAARREVFEKLSKFAPGFGVETAMTIDAARAGFRVKEVETAMGHAETGRDVKGFAHRGRQFISVAAVLIGRLFYKS